MDNKRNIFIYALQKTIPVMVGYLFLGMAYGILMETRGYGAGWALATSVFVYAGSLQYASIPMLAAGIQRHREPKTVPDLRPDRRDLFRHMCRKDSGTYGQGKAAYADHPV